MTYYGRSSLLNLAIPLIYFLSVHFGLTIHLKIKRDCCNRKNRAVLDGNRAYSQKDINMLEALTCYRLSLYATFTQCTEQQLI